MEEWFVYITEKTVVIINILAFVVIVFGTFEAFATAVRIAIAGRPPRIEGRSVVWLRFGRWLVAGLTFQLAADIIETSISPSWEEIGRFAAIAVVRTFLNFFLNHDMEELIRRKRESGAAHDLRPEVE